jgi:hypothetical protein
MAMPEGTRKNKWRLLLRDSWNADVPSDTARGEQGTANERTQQDDLAAA